VRVQIAGGSLFHRIALGALALASLVPACTPRATTQQCTRHSDCPQPLRCVASACREECGDDRDCPAGSRCVVEEGRRTCGATPDGADGSAVDAVDAMDTGDAIDGMDTVDAIDAMDTVDAIDAMDTVDAIDAMDTVDAVDAMDSADVSTMGSLTVVATRAGRLQLNASFAWPTVRSIATAAIVDDGARSVGAAGYIDTLGGQGYYIARLAIRFPPIAPLPATARMVGARIEAVPNRLYDDPAQVFHVVRFTPTTPGMFVGADFALSHWGSISFGSVAGTSLRVATRVAIPLDGAAVAALSTTVANDLGMRAHWDLMDMTPGNGPRLMLPVANFAPCCTPGGMEDIRLVVDYVAP